MTNQKHDDDFNSGPAYKQPWFWLIMAPLMTTIVVGTSMLVYSIIAYDGGSINKFEKDGFDVTPSVEKEKMAQSLNLIAQLIQTDNKIEINLNGRIENLPKHLLLTIYSPVSKSKDIKITLNLEKDKFIANLDTDHMVLSERVMQLVDPGDSSWLIQAKSAWPLTAPVAFTPFLVIQ
ncbi:FixH family protein [Marinicellulosiphila megalodicopiae]|uniref:FixH family protein n=1 Tax=Marinicellulosiphila megalodicopiae TaxID=2724896 RepID=UPI003BB0A116